jgi:hypothetical protein
MSRYVSTSSNITSSDAFGKSHSSSKKGSLYYGVDDDYGLEEHEEGDDDINLTKVYHVNDVFIDADDEEIERAAEEASLAARRLQLEIAKQDKVKANVSSRNVSSSSGGRGNFWNTLRARGCHCYCSTRTPKFLAITAIVVVILVLVASLSIWTVSIRSSISSPSAESVYHDEIESASSEGEHVVVVIPPIELETYCDVTSDGILNDHEQCQNYCNLGRCCWEQISGNNSNNNNNCYVTNPQTCPKYQVCKVLLAGKTPGSLGQTLIPAPKSLQHYCSEKSIIRDDGRQMCDFLCTPALCCIGQDGDCSLLQPQSCDTYNSCRNVWSTTTNAIETSRPTATDATPSPIESICKHYNEEKSSSESLLCEKVCSSAMCCFTGACLEQNAVTCMQYKGCPTSISNNEKLSLQKVPRPLQPLEDVCSSKDNNWNSQEDSSVLLAECAKECAAGGCCFGTGITNCYLKNEETCKLYEPCLSLPDLNDVPELPNVVDVLCSPDKVATDDGRTSCTNLCKEASCCLADSGPDNCYDVNQDICEQYRACTILVNVPEPPTDLFDLCCSAGSNSPSKCQEACLKASCCFVDGPESCLPFNELTCESYNICREKVDFSAAAAAAATHANDLSSPLATICSTSSLQTVEGRIECRKQCEPAECCTTQQKGEMNCTENNKELCELYEPYCSNIWSSKDKLEGVEEGDGGLQLSTIARICSVQNIATEGGKAQCEEECRPAACCDSVGAYSCLNDNQSWCKEYLNACKILNKP